MVVTRMDTLKSGWTPCVYYTTPYSILHLCEFIGHIFEKSGEIRVGDSCARKRVENKV